MITQYDMASGEVFYEEDAIEVSDNVAENLIPETELRLQTVAEAVSIETASRSQGMPIDLVTTSIGAFLNAQK